MAECQWFCLANGPVTGVIGWTEDTSLTLLQIQDFETDAGK